MYMTVKQTAERWGISDRRVRILCSEGKIAGVIREGRSWMIPSDANAAETAGITGIFQVGISDSDELELMPISGRKG